MKKILLAVYIIFFSCCLLKADDLPDPPSPSRLVVDWADMLNDQEEQALERKLEAYEDSTSNEIAIVTIPSINDYAIEDFANKLFEKWKIGKEGRNNGILILIPKEQRGIRIEVGYGLEPVIPDLFAKQVEDQIIIPEFKNGHFYQGLEDGTTALMQKAAGEFKGIKKKKSKGGSVWTVFIIIMIILFIVNRFQGPKYDNFSRRGRRGGGFFGGFGGGGFGGGGFGGGGGGFGGFGGGSSGGGGASGRW